MLDEKVKSDVIEAYVKLFEDYAKTYDLEGIYDDTLKRESKPFQSLLQGKLSNLGRSF